MFNHCPTLPPFSFSLASPHPEDTTSMPDYYRSTRSEKYGPYLMPSTEDHSSLFFDEFATLNFNTRCPTALRKTVNFRKHKSVDYNASFLLPDIFEEDDIEIESEHHGSDDIYKCCDRSRSEEKRSSRIRRLWALLKRRCRTRDGRAIRFYIRK